jgi:hypothetical protein
LTFNIENISHSSNIFKEIDYKTFKYSVIAMLILVIPFNVLHELGHLIPCWIDGNQGTMAIGLLFSQATCSGLDESFIFAFFGGVFAAIVALVSLTVPQINKVPFLVITFTSFGIGHLLNAIIEGFFRDWYMTSDLSIPVISLASFGIFTVSLMVFGRRKNE